MRIGLIADIHANLQALEAVLDDMPAVEDIVCAGDIVGYNPWPEECLERVRAVSSLTVQGNYDRNVETPQRYGDNDMAQAGLKLARQELSSAQREWLARLPERTEFADGMYRLVHSHPDPDRLGSYVRPAQFPEMRPYLDDHAGIVLAHTHVQHEANIDGRLIVNPGSVGQPRNRDERAAYVVLDTATDEVELRGVEYDIDRVITRVEERGLPRETGTRLLDGS